MNERLEQLFDDFFLRRGSGDLSEYERGKYLIQTQNYSPKEYAAAIKWLARQVGI